MAGPVLIYGSPVAWTADRLAALPAQPLRRAVVLTSSERLAHAIRLELCHARNNPAAALGVEFARPVEFARGLLARAGRPRNPGWEAIRPARVVQALQSDSLAGSLAYFEPTQLRSGAGYADALIETIGDLEGGGLTPADLDWLATELTEDRRGAARLRDVAAIWRAADADQRDWRSASQILLEAAALFEAVPRRAPVPPTQGQLSLLDAAQAREPDRAQQPERDQALPPTFVVVETTPGAALLRFVRAFPGAAVVIQDARPVRTETHRWRTLLGVSPAAPVDDGGNDEVSIARRYLFETPECLTDPQRPRSAGPDGTVDFEAYAGVEAEIDAAAVWVAEQITAGTPLARIALLIPDKSSYAALLVDRLARLRADEHAAGVATYVAGGLPLSFSAGGRRLLALLAALGSGLEATATLRIMPALRRGGQAADAPATRLSPSRAAEVVYAAGIAGGGRGDSQGAQEWLVKLRSHRARLAAIVAADDAATKSDRVRSVNAHNAHRWLRDVEPILPAIEALDALAASVAGGADLATLWAGVEAFCRKHLLLPPTPPGLVARLAAAFEPALADAAVASLPSAHALRWLEQRIHSERQPCGRFGEARVFIGTPWQAAGLEFDAVRIMGLAEGGVPRTAHDDPIVPDELRTRMDGILERSGGAAIIPRQADKVLDDLHGVFRAVAGARRRLAVSAPRQWVDRSEREVSGVVLELATALGRGAAEAGQGDVPTAGRLRSNYFNVGERNRHAAVRRLPLAAKGAWAFVPEAYGGSGPVRVPEAWFAAGPLSLARAAALANAAGADEPTAVDGALGPIGATWQRLGHPERPLSASALGLLLGCPHRFLLERLLHWQEPPRRPATDAIEPGTYGTLFHRIAETFLREAGEPICAHAGSLEWWVRRAQEIADAEFAELVEHYPLRGAEARERERQRLGAQVESLVRDEWERPPRRFVAAELSFGRDSAVGLAAGATQMHIWGAIDRLDQLADGTYSVRDIKTGRVRDLAEEEVNAGRDLQIGVYALVAEAALAGADGVPARVGEAVYVHPSAAQEPERGFRRAQLEGLLARTSQWLRVAADLLEGGLFVRTTNTEDCRTCPFVPTCGEGAQARSQQKLSSLPPTHPLAGFVALKNERHLDD